jgi:hypothetical protein
MTSHTPLKACQRCGIDRQVNQNRQTPYCRPCAAIIRDQLRHQNEHQQPAWMQSAACRSVDPELFFDGDLIKTMAYKQVCGRCPVAAECLMYAYAVNDVNGIWGGMNERQRRHLIERGAGPTDSSDDITRCRACGAWKLANRFCGPCHQATIKRRIDA